MNIMDCETLNIFMAQSTNHVKDPIFFSGYVSNELHGIRTLPPLLILKNFTSVLQQPKPKVALWIILSLTMVLPFNCYTLLQLSHPHFLFINLLSPPTSCLPPLYTKLKNTIGFTCFSTLLAQVLFHLDAH